MMISPQSAIPAQAVVPAQAQPAVSPTSKISEEDKAWALRLENRVAQGFEPTEQEIDKYKAIYEVLHPAAAPETASAETPVAAEKPESYKGLLDYPKDLAMSVTEYAAEGQAKNMVELFEDAADIKRNLGDSWEHLKKGKILNAAGDTFRAVGNTASAGLNFLQVGFSAMLGGVSTVISLPLNLLDKGAEKAGQHFAGSENAAGKAIGRVFTVLGGENSNVSYQQAVQTAVRRGLQEAHSD